MTALDTTLHAPALQPSDIRARRAGFLADVRTIALRSLHNVARDFEFVIPSLVIPVFFYVVNIGALQDLTEGQAAGFDFKAFQLPVAVLFGITGVSRAGMLVLDIQDGYFDRVLLTPVRRGAILLGMMVSDIALVVALTLPVLVLGFATGVEFETGIGGVAMVLLLACLWGLAFTGFPYAIALKTGNPAAVNTSYMLFFPFMFLTTSFVPRGSLTGWMDAIAGWNPVTYLLEGMRSLIYEGWEWGDISKALLSIGILSLFSMSLCFSALRGRVRRG